MGGPAERPRLGSRRLVAWCACLVPRGQKLAHSTLTCLGGSKSGHAGGVVVATVLDAVGVGGLGVEAGVGLEGVGPGEGVDGHDQLKISMVQDTEQFA